MRVLIDTTYARRAPLSGTGIYIERLCAELGQLPDVELLTVANPRRRPPAGGGAGSVRNALTDLWWTTVELPRMARRTGAQLIHHPLPAVSVRAPVPQVVTIVDLAFERLPEHFDRGFRIFASRAHRAAASSADAVVAISETTAADARELWGIRGERIVVAPLGPGQALPQSLAQGLPRRHFLYVGDAEPRKNLRVLIAAYARYRARVRIQRSSCLPAQLMRGRPVSGSCSGRTRRSWRGSTRAPSRSYIRRFTRAAWPRSSG